MQLAVCTDSFISGLPKEITNKLVVIRRVISHTAQAFDHRRRTGIISPVRSHFQPNISEAAGTGKSNFHGSCSLYNLSFFGKILVIDKQIISIRDGWINGIIYFYFTWLEGYFRHSKINVQLRKL